MRTFYTYEQYAEWRKSSGGAATDGIRLVGSDPSSWPGRYAAQSRIAELEAESEALHRANIQLAKSCQKAHEALADSRDTAWNDAIEAAASLQINGMDVISPVAKAYILGILRR